MLGSAQLRATFRQIPPHLLVGQGSDLPLQDGSAFVGSTAYCTIARAAKPAYRMKEGDMAFDLSSTSADDAWLYTQAPPPAPAYTSYDHAQLSQSQPYPPRAIYAHESTFLGTPDAIALTSSVEASGGGYSHGDGGLQLDSYADPAFAYVLRQPHSSCTTPSPVPPALSPASSASASSSAYSSLVSPTPYVARTSPPTGSQSALLPSANIHEESPTGCGQRKAQGSSWFAERQEAYPQQPTFDFTSYALAPCASAPPSTPHRQSISSSHLYRSPSAYSTASSPPISPFHRTTTPKPYTRPLRRRSSTGTCSLNSPTRRGSQSTYAMAPQVVVDANGSPSRAGRRQASLTIELPPAYGLRVRLPTIGASPQVPPQETFSSASMPTSASADSETGLSEASMFEVEQLLGDMGSILEPQGTSGFDSNTIPASAPYSPRSSVPGGTYAAQSSLQRPSPPNTSHVPTSISISGVTLAAEDLALFDTPTLFSAGFDTRSYPASAPAWRTSFDLPPLPPSSSRAPWDYSPQYAPSSYSADSLPPPPDHYQVQYGGHLRSASAPRQIVYPPPPNSPTSSTKRRRSSIDTASLASHTFNLSPPPAASRASYTYGPPPPALQHYQLPLPLQPAPGPYSSSPPVSPTVSPGRPSPKPTPKRKRAANKPAVAMFVNYSASDAKKLLSGVAPSGSSKRRREEEEAARLLAEQGAFTAGQPEDQRSTGRELEVGDLLFVIRFSDPSPTLPPSTLVPFASYFSRQCAEPSLSGQQLVSLQLPT
ncbi:hypothetical protein JCM1840_003933 [Sporobolomyces johnsonii]